MVWLPVAFVCLFGGDCGFLNGELSVSTDQCLEQNHKVRQRFAVDTRIEKFQLTCLEIKPEYPT